MLCSVLSQSSKSRVVSEQDRAISFSRSTALRHSSAAPSLGRGTGYDSMKDVKYRSASSFPCWADLQANHQPIGALRTERSQASSVGRKYVVLFERNLPGVRQKLAVQVMSWYVIRDSDNSAQ